jgi:hypothetical protein
MHQWLVIFLALTAGPVFAQARRAAVYPIFGEGVPAADCADVEGTIHAALLRSTPGGPFTLGNPPTLELSCGPASKVDPACLAKSAGTGVVLYGIARRSGALFSVSLSAVDARGKVAGPVRVAVDPLLYDPQTFVAALERLASLSSPPPVAQVTEPQPAPARPKAPAAAVRPSVPGAWIGKAAIGTGAAAVAALAGGAVFGYLANKNNDDLSSRYAAHTLHASDAAEYQSVRRQAKLANVLFIASGALAVVSLVLFDLAPDENPVYGTKF